MKLHLCIIASSNQNKVLAALDTVVEADWIPMNIHDKNKMESFRPSTIHRITVARIDEDPWTIMTELD